MAKKKKKNCLCEFFFFLFQKKSEDIEKLRRLIRNLQEQEQGYRGLLQNTLVGECRCSENSRGILLLMLQFEII